jgi:Cystatin domain
MIRYPHLALAALALAAACKPDQPSAPPGADPQVVGGYSPAGTSEPEVLAAAKFAAAAASKGTAQLLTVDDAQKQVVAGMNYRLTMTLSDGARWEATVYRNLDKRMELTSSRQLPPLVQPEMRVDAQGLQLTEQGKQTRHLPFGTAQGEVLKALSFRGPPQQSTNSDCGEGPVQFAQWPDGLSLLFQNGKFGGWGLSGKGGTLHTTDALRIGSELGQVRVAGHEEIAETSLGTEFTVNGVHGVLEGKGDAARVSAMWSGELSCVFR